MLFSRSCGGSWSPSNYFISKFSLFSRSCQPKFTGLWSAAGWAVAVVFIQTCNEPSTFAVLLKNSLAPWQFGWVNRFDIIYWIWTNRWLWPFLEHTFNYVIDVISIFETIHTTNIYFNLVKHSTLPRSLKTSTNYHLSMLCFLVSLFPPQRMQAYNHFLGRHRNQSKL